MTLCRVFEAFRFQPFYSPSASLWFMIRHVQVLRTVPKYRWLQHKPLFRINSKSFAWIKRLNFINYSSLCATTERTISKVPQSNIQPIRLCTNRMTKRCSCTNLLMWMCVQRNVCRFSKCTSHRSDVTQIERAHKNITKSVRFMGFVGLVHQSCFQSLKFS